MNIIEAWKKAKEGEKIYKANSHYEFLRYKQDKIFHEFLERLPYEYLLSDDWEIKRQPLVWEGECEWRHSAAYDITYPNVNDVNKFIGKRTKIRIEEILE